VVLTFVDLTALKQAEQLATEVQDYAMSIVDTVREQLVVLDAKLRLKSASKAFFDKFAVSAEETLSKSLSDLGDRQWDIPDLRKLLAEVLPESKKIEDYEVEHEFPNLGGERCYSMAEQRDSKEPLLLLAIEDVTERKRAEETLRTHAEEISRLARGMVGRELRIIEMKKEVNELCHRLGEVGRYPLEFEQDGKERPDSPRPRNQP
jgi:two-component system CheB/CheR fusion protein